MFFFSRKKIYSIYSVITKALILSTIIATHNPPHFYSVDADIIVLEKQALSLILAAGKGFYCELLRPLKKIKIITSTTTRCTK